MHKITELYNVTTNVNRNDSNQHLELRLLDSKIPF